MIVISQNNSKKTALLVWLSGVLVLLLVIAGYWGYNQYLADDGLILSNVYAAGVNIGGKTPEEAKVLVERQTDLTYPYEDMVIRFPDQDLHLKPADTGVTLDIDKLIKDAYNYGRTGSRTEKEVIREMADKIIHRGPDMEGYYFSEDMGADSVTLGFRRLSIIDLADGAQPMYNEDGSVVIVFNGEIYNFMDLREELIAKGHVFKTRCDTE